LNIGKHLKKAGPIAQPKPAGCFIDISPNDRQLMFGRIQRDGSHLIGNRVPLPIRGHPDVLSGARILIAPYMVVARVR
jgi:hypothetical protein